MKNKNYIIQNENNLSDLSKVHKITEKALQKANPNIDFNRLKKGTSIVIPNSNWNLILLVLFVFIILSSSGIIYIIRTNKKEAKAKTEIILKGDKISEIELGSNFIDDGYDLYINNKKTVLTANIDTSNINSQKVGIYDVIYSYTDENGNEYQTVRKVQVVDSKKPLVTLKGNALLKLLQGESYNEPGFTAIDNYDGDITNLVKISGLVDIEKLGTYTLNYDVCDKSNNCTKETRKVEVIKKEEDKVQSQDDKNNPQKPKEENYVILELMGYSTMYIEYLENYVEPGYTVRSSDGNIKSKVKVSGNIDTKILGTYTLKYEITNSLGKKDTATRTIIVRDTTPPVIKLHGSNPYILELGTTYIEQRASVTDNYDNSPKLNIINQVNTNALGTYTVIYEAIDKSGNKKIANRIVKVIDTIPQVTISYSNTSKTKDSVTVTMTSDKEINTPSTWANTGNNKKFTKVYYQNTNEILTITSLEGSANSVNIIIANIDKTGPIITIIGANPLTIERTQPYVELEATVTDASSNPSSYTTSGTVNTEIPGTYTITYTGLDSLGNESITTRTVIVEDTTPPVVTITYSSEFRTNENVIATINASEEIKAIPGWNKVNSNSYKKTYIQNTNENIEIEDIYSNKTLKNISIANIDKEGPIITINGEEEITIELNGTYIDQGATATDDGITVSVTSSGTVNPSIPGIYRVTYEAYDDLSNKSVKVRIVNVVDTLAPTVSVTYSTTERTKSSVTVTIETDKEILRPDGWLIAGQNKYTKIYNSNTDTDLTITDLSGHNVATRIIITNIDKIPPVITINGEEEITIERTSLYQDAGALAIDNIDNEVSVTSSGTVNPNITGTYEIIYEASDLLGNTASKKRIVTVIDTTPPIVTINYSKTTQTKENVVVTITSNEEIKSLANYQYIGNNKYSKEYSYNLIENIVIEDIAGNKITKEISIQNIDKVPPVIDLIGSNPYQIPLNTTYVDPGIVVSDNKDENIDSVINGTVNVAVAGIYEITYTATDLAGNTTTIVRTVEVVDYNIVSNLTYNITTPTNTNVIATLVVSREIATPSGWTNIGDNKTFTKEYSDNITSETVNFNTEDNLYSGSTTITITNIDKTNPVGNITYNISNYTNGNVIATLTTDENIKTPENWTINGNSSTFIRPFSTNINENITIEDIAGNISTVPILISNIDKTKPIITSITNSSNNNWSKEDITITPNITENESGLSKILWNINDGEWLEGFSGIFTEETNSKIGIKAVDNANNESNVMYTYIKIDKTPPQITLSGDPVMSIIVGTEFNDPGSIVTDNYSSNLTATVSGTVDYNTEGTYNITYSAEDLAGNTISVRRRVIVTVPIAVSYSRELKAIETLIIDIEENSGQRIGTPLTEETAIEIRGIKYYKEWYLITSAELLNYDLNMDTTHGPYIVRYEYTPGAVLSIPGEIISGSPVHTFNYTGDPEEPRINSDGLLTAVTKDSTKSETNWGESIILNGPGRYDDNNGLLLGTQIGTLEIDQSRPINNQYSIGFTVKGIIPQTRLEQFPRTIVAISNTSGRYLSWIGIRDHYLHIYSFSDSEAKQNIEWEMTVPGFASIDLRTIVKEETEDGPVYYDFNNEYLSVQVTATRKTGTQTTYTHVYINGKLVKTFESGSANLQYGTLTIGDLRPNRNLRYNGSIYNFVFYSEVIDQSVVTQNWNYFKSDLGIVE